VVVAVAEALLEDVDGRCSFQKPEELAGSALTSSLSVSTVAVDAREEFEVERVSHVARLFGAGFSLSVFSEWDLSVTGLLLSPTVALRMGVGFFFPSFGFVSGFVSAGSSVTASFSRPIIHHEPEDLVCTLTDSVFLSSMSPIGRSRQSKEKRGGSGGRTTHVPHGDFEPLPVPSIISTVEVAQDLLELVQAFSGLVREEVLADFVPAILRDLALETAFLHLIKPCVDWGILLGIAEKTWWVLPRFEDGLEVEFFCLERVKHSGIGDGARDAGSCVLELSWDVVEFLPPIFAGSYVRLENASPHCREAITHPRSGSVGQ